MTTASGIRAVLAAGCAGLTVAAAGAQPVAAGHGEGIAGEEANVLIGIWGAEKILGTALEGRVRVQEAGGELQASLAGVKAAVVSEGASVAIEFPRDQGAFRGTFSPDRKTIAGHWIAPVSNTGSNRFATPVRLHKKATGGWQGEVRPFQERMSLYLRFARDEAGKIGAILRNPERNVGVFIRADHARVEGAHVRLVNSSGETVLSGVLREGEDVLSMPVAGAGTFDFTRRQRHEAAGIYPRPDTSAYTYQPPLPDTDGWRVAHAADLGLRAESLRAFVQQILDTETTSHRTPHIQDLLIARRGQLILEEHFYGFHTDRPHDTRSAGKSITSMLTGQAVSEAAFDVGTRVYTLFPDSVANPDPRKADITVEHLLTMRAGYDCDDNDENTPGNEDRMQSQSGQPDWLRYTLDLPLVRAPGQAGVYCTGGINLLAGVVTQTTGVWFPEFFRTRLAEPLGIDHYHMNLDPLGRGYGGGGLRLRPRDFLKFAQTMLDGGRWNGRQVLAESWVKASLTPRASINGPDDYGYAWWRTVHQRDGRSFESWSASGNGGQFLIIVPEYELAMSFNGGNYGDFRTWIRWRDELMPALVTDAIQEASRSN